VALKEIAVAVIACYRGTMSETIFAERLAYFKQNEKTKVVLLIADNSELIKIIVTWAILDIRCDYKLTELSGDSEKEVW
jgi:hypothetical protein